MDRQEAIRKVEQAIRILHGACPHDEYDETPPEHKSECLRCIAETAVSALGK